MHCYFSPLAALPSITNNAQESVGIDSVTLSWEIKGDTNEDYHFEIVVKEYDQALNPNIKGEQSEASKGLRRATVSKLKSGTTYSATIQAVLTETNVGLVSTSTVFTTSKFSFHVILADKTSYNINFFIIKLILSDAYLI